MRKTAKQNGWVTATNKRWKVDADGAIFRFAKATVDKIFEEANAILEEAKRTELRKHANKSESAVRIRAMIELAWSEKEIVATPQAFDADPWLLGVQNGVLDLKTGVFRDARRDDYISMSAGVSFDRSAKCPNFLALLETITGGDQETISYIQRFLGYMLTGLVREEIMVVLYGTGRNGKSTFRETLHALMGDYAITADAGLLMAPQSGERATPEVARLQGRRLVAINETAQTDKLNEARVKFITSNEHISARQLYSAQVDFIPTHKAVLTTNHKPRVDGTDDGIWRRLHLVPFLNQIPLDSVDVNYREEKLLPELSGILNFALEGLAEYLRIGLRRQRCDAKSKNLFTVTPEGQYRSRSPRCRSWALNGKTRCRMHGGASTGPKTPEGKARAVAAMVAGRRAWVERMHGEGKTLPCGRKTGSAWITPRMRQSMRADVQKTNIDQTGLPTHHLDHMKSCELLQ